MPCLLISFSFASLSHFCDNLRAFSFKEHAHTQVRERAQRERKRRITYRIFVWVSPIAWTSFTYISRVTGRTAIIHRGYSSRHSCLR